jgi:hypothetical protein
MKDDAVDHRAEGVTRRAFLRLAQRGFGVATIALAVPAVAVSTTGHDARTRSDRLNAAEPATTVPAGKQEPSTSLALNPDTTIEPSVTIGPDVTLKPSTTLT